MEKFDNDFDSIITYNLSRTEKDGKLSTTVKSYIFPKEKSKFLKSIEDVFSTSDSTPENITKSSFANKIVNYIMNLNRSADLNYEDINKYLDSVLEENMDFESFIGESDVSYIEKISMKNIENYNEALKDGHIVNRILEADDSLEEYEDFDPEEEFAEFDEVNGELLEFE